MLINQWSNIDVIKCSEYSFRCLPSGEFVLDTLNINKSNFLYAISIQFYMIIGWRVLAFLALFIRSYNR
jgi:hypothetical protein